MWEFPAFEFWQNRPIKKETLFYGWMDLSSRVFFFFFFFFFDISFLSHGKNDSPKNAQISKKTDIFGRKILEKYSQLFSSKFSETLAKNADFTWFLANLGKKKEFSQIGKIGLVRAIKHGFLFFVALWEFYFKL